MTSAGTGQQRWTRRPEGSTWGDFGPDDQAGRMNLITPEVRLAALREVVEGEVFALSLPLDYPGGDRPDSLRRGPELFANSMGEDPVYNHRFTDTDLTCDDGVRMSLQYSTQWDAFSHWGQMFDVDGSGVEQPVFYNGFRAGEDVVAPADGGPFAHRLGIENMAVTGVQGRGVLIDLERAFGPGRTLVGHDALQQVIADQGVEIRPGDFVLLYTGYGDVLMAAQKDPDPQVLMVTGAALDGYDPALIDWIESSGIVALCSDNSAVEIFNFAGVGGHDTVMPLHEHCLFRLGVHLGELWWLTDLALHLRATGRHAFLLTAPPLRLPGAVGSPATPVATV